MKSPDPLDPGGQGSRGRALPPPGAGRHGAAAWEMESGRHIYIIIVYSMNIYYVPLCM